MARCAIIKPHVVVKKGTVKKTMRGGKKGDRQETGKKPHCVWKGKRGQSKKIIKPHIVGKKGTVKKNFA